MPDNIGYVYRLFLNLSNILNHLKKIPLKYIIFINTAYLGQSMYGNILKRLPFYLAAYQHICILFALIFPMLH